MREKQKRSLAVRGSSNVGIGHWALALGGCGGQGSQEPFPVFENLALPPLLVEIPAARSA
jgi:hypothetical protein